MLIPIRLFETKTDAINYIKAKFSYTTEEAEIYLSKNTFITSDGSDRVWITDT